MTHLYERRFLRCPYVRAREYLRKTVAEAIEEKHPQLLRLRYTFPTGGSLSKDVLVQYETAEDPLHFDEPWRVRWAPEGGGPYPSFDGQMIVRADDDYRNAILELHGDYAPPLGAFGRAFDLAAGSKIAAATARDLLERIGTAMEVLYENEERVKNGA